MTFEEAMEKNVIEMVPPPHPPLFEPTENQIWYRFCIFDMDTVEAKVIDQVTIHKPSGQAKSEIYAGLHGDYLEMALDWMKQLKRNPFKRAVADRSMLH